MSNVVCVTIVTVAWKELSRCYSLIIYMTRFATNNIKKTLPYNIASISIDTTPPQSHFKSSTAILVHVPAGVKEVHTDHPNQSVSAVPRNSKPRRSCYFKMSKASLRYQQSFG